MPPAPLAPGAPGRAQLEAMVKLVHDVTGRALNEIRTDLAHTHDAQTTIERIMEGQFLKGTARDPGLRAGSGVHRRAGDDGAGVDMGVDVDIDMDMDMDMDIGSGREVAGYGRGYGAVQMLDAHSALPAVVPNWPWREREREIGRDTESRSPEKKNAPLQVIDLCGSEDESPPPPAPAPPAPPLLPAPQPQRPTQPLPETWRRSPAADQPASTRWTHTRRPPGEPRAPPPLPLLSAPFEPAERPGSRHRGPAAVESSSSSSSAWTTPVRARPPHPPATAMPASRHVDTWDRGGPATAPPPQPAMRRHVPAAASPSPPPQPDFADSPLFRYQSSSSPPVVMSSPEGPKPKPKPRVVTHANFQVNPPPATPAAPPKTPVAGKQQKLDVITIDSDPADPDPDPGPDPAPDSGSRAPPAPHTHTHTHSAGSAPGADSLPRSARKRDRVASPLALSTATRSLLQEFEEAEARGGSDDDDDDGELVVGAGAGAGKKRKKRAPAKSARTRAKASPAKRKTEPLPEASEEAAPAPAPAEGAEEEGSEGTAEAQPAAAKKSTRPTDAEKARRAAEREAARLQRQQERDAKAAARKDTMAQKKRERDAKELEKRQEQELVLADKLRLSRRDSVQEMIVDMSQHLKDSATGQSLARLLVGLGCEVNTTWYPALPGGGGVGEWRVAKWRRKVTAEWDEARALFVPLPVMRVADEHHVLVYLTAQELWQLAEGAGGVGVGLGGGGGGGAARLAEHVQLVSGFSAGTQQELKILYLLEGVEAFMRKNRNNRDREYKNRVRAALGEGPNIPAKAEIMDEGVLQDALLELQIVHGCLVHHTASGIESAEWISKFTTDISTIPYKNSRSAIGAAGFCTDAGQLRVGIGKADTFRRMLEEVYRVTPSAAEAVVRVYPDVRALVAAFAEFGEEVLADLPILTMRGGKTTDKTVGPSTSRKICAVFTNSDPDSVEI